MFTRAGFSRKCRFVCAARVAMLGGRGSVWAHLFVWPASGEFAWASRTRIVWPHLVVIYNRFYPTIGRFPTSTLRGTQST
ncbi:MAG: hypothetical protein JJE27_03550 [Thermoleophilia bacterium]|nr:hypothetical protein [Thermoleophilia bacterium]